MRFAACLLALLAVSCTPEIENALFDRESFENNWWEINTIGYRACFFVDENGYVRIYEPGHSSYIAGDWTYYEPGTYVVNSIHIEEPETLVVKKRNDCWNITGYTVFAINACECTLLE